MATGPVFFKPYPQAPVVKPPPTLKSITLCYVTSRSEPKFNWFIDSLRPQVRPGDQIDLILIDSSHITTYEDRIKFGHDDNTGQYAHSFRLICTTPKPNIWQGKHRVTREDWWAVSNARNTGLCLCASDYIVWIDDRCVLATTWLEGIRRAAAGKYAVCGTYEKWNDLEVVNGAITSGKMIGRDTRPLGGIVDCGGQFWGGTLGCPVDWALSVNGFEELCDGLGSEDYMFGHMLRNNGYPTKFDPSIKITEDRTPAASGPVMKKGDKNIHPIPTNAKSYAALNRFGKARRADNWGHSMADIRQEVLAGSKFPTPDPQFIWKDWFDGQPICEM